MKRIMQAVAAAVMALGLTFAVAAPAQAFTSFRINYACSAPAKARIWINNISGASVSWTVYNSAGQYVQSNTAAPGESRYFYTNVSGTGYAWVTGSGATKPQMYTNCY